MAKKRAKKRKIKPKPRPKELTLGEGKGDLTPMQSKFVDRYFQCFDADESARSAGYSTKFLHQTSYQILRSPNVFNYIKKNIDELGITKERIQAEIARIGIEGKDKQGQYVDPAVQLKALIALAKIAKLFEDKTEINIEHKQLTYVVGHIPEPDDSVDFIDAEIIEQKALPEPEPELEPSDLQDTPSDNVVFVYSDDEPI